MRFLIPTRGVGACNVNSFSPLLNLSRELGRLFEAPFESTSTEAPTSDPGFGPALDLSETEQSLLVKLDLPGVARDQVKVSLQDDVLTISGERAADVLEKGAGYHRRERANGRFERSIELARSVDESKITATFKDGVLIVTLPKTPDAKPRQIDIAVN